MEGASKLFFALRTRITFDDKFQILFCNSEFLENTSIKVYIFRKVIKFSSISDLQKSNLF